MAWTNPMTFNANAILQAAQLNTHLRDNLLALKDPPTAAISSTTAYQTTSASFVDINAALDATVVTAGGRLLITCSLGVNLAGGTGWSSRFLLDGVVFTFTGGANVSWTVALTAGTHTFKPQWQVNGGGTLTMTSYNVVVREVS